MSSRIACESGIRGAPKTPCRMRAATIWGKVSVRPQSTEVRAKPATASNCKRRRPISSASRPTTNVVMAVATMYEVMTQEI